MDTYKHRCCKVKNEYMAVVKQDGEWWTGWIEEIPGVNCQERTQNDLLKSLEFPLKEAIEFNRKDALSSAEGSYIEGIK